MCTPSPGMTVRWPSVRWDPHLGCVGGVCVPCQFVELSDQHQEKVRVEASGGTHAAGHRQHLPKGASGLWNQGFFQAQTRQTGRGQDLHARRTLWMGVTTVSACCPRAPVTRLSWPLGPGLGCPLASWTEPPTARASSWDPAEPFSAQSSCTSTCPFTRWFRLRLRQSSAATLGARGM